MLEPRRGMQGGGGRAPHPSCLLGECSRGSLSLGSVGVVGTPPRSHRPLLEVCKQNCLDATQWCQPGYYFGNKGDALSPFLVWCSVTKPPGAASAGEPCGEALGREWEHPSVAARWARLPIRSQVRRFLRPQKSRRHKVPWLEGLREGVPGSRGQPGVGASRPAGCQGHGGRDPGNQAASMRGPGLGHPALRESERAGAAVPGPAGGNVSWRAVPARRGLCVPHARHGARLTLPSSVIEIHCQIY